MAKSRRAHPSKRAGEDKQADLARDRGRMAKLDLFFTHQDRPTHVGEPIWKDVSALAGRKH